MNSIRQTKIKSLKQYNLSLGILSSSWLQLENTLSVLDAEKLHLLHFDIADGHFCSLFTAGPYALEQFGEGFFKDVHLLVSNPELVVRECLKYKCDILTIQAESDCNLGDIYRTIRNISPDTLNGISFCPNTQLDLLISILEQIDVIQLLTFDPRTQEQLTCQELIDRISELLDILGETRKNKIISIDGKMTYELAQELTKYDIDWVVVGSAIFRSKEFITTLHQWQRLSD